MKHAEGCKWPEISFYVYVNNPNGPDESLSIDSERISYFPNTHTGKDSAYISFNYCPLCGCKLAD